MNNFWNERYKGKEYIYGMNPNRFLVEQLRDIPPGRILFPCDGEGRNSVFAAKNGWLTEAFDNSEVGMSKAMQLAKYNSVMLSYRLADVQSVEYPRDKFDVIALLYAHFTPETRTALHYKVISWLKPGGIVILEAFNPEQINNTSGGPKDASMLYTEEMLNSDFNGLQTQISRTETIVLDEGAYHQGKADVIRYVGIKRNNIP